MQIGGETTKSKRRGGPLPMIGNGEQQSDRMFYNLLLWHTLDFAVCLVPGSAKLCQLILLSPTACFDFSSSNFSLQGYIPPTLV